MIETEDDVDEESSDSIKGLNRYGFTTPGYDNNRKHGGDGTNANDYQLGNSNIGGNIGKIGNTGNIGNSVGIGIGIGNIGGGNGTGK